MQKPHGTLQRLPRGGPQLVKVGGKLKPPFQLLQPLPPRAPLPLGQKLQRYRNGLLNVQPPLVLARRNPSKPRRLLQTVLKRQRVVYFNFGLTPPPQKPLQKLPRLPVPPIPHPLRLKKRPRTPFLKR